MRQVVLSLLSLLRPSRRKGFCLVVLVLLFATFGPPQAVRFLARPRGAQRTSDEAARRMLELAKAYQGPSTLLSRVSYRDSEYPLPSRPGLLHRRSWTAAVQANDQILDLILNDKSGNLVSVFDTGRAIAAQAAKVSFQAARNLQLIPVNAEAALAGVPESRADNHVWHVDCRVRDTPASTEYQVVMTVKRKNG